jgi:tripartite-type tricarboxylate transporter receptor subunit TctC
MKLLSRLKVATFCFVAAMTAAQAQTAQPVTLVVGTPPGGSADGLARLLAQRLPEHLGRAVVVENKTGALGALAVQEMLAAPPSRQVFVVAPFTTVLFPSLTQNTPRYNPFEDVRAVARLASFPLGVVVSTSIGVNTPAELAAWLKRNPTRATIGMGGLGGQTHFLGLQLGKALNVNAALVPYRGNAPLLNELMAGHLPIGVMVAGEIKPQATEGRVRVVGMLTPKRSPLAPEVPTFAEQGIAVDSGESWFGMWTSATVAKADVQNMESALRKVLATPEVKAALVANYALVADFQPSDVTAASLRAEHERWAPTIKASGFKSD